MHPGWINLVLDALMISLDVLVSHELADRTAQRGLPHKDHPVQALIFDRAHKALGKRVQIWGSGRQSDHLRPESLVTLLRNDWSPSSGIHGHLGPEYAHKV